MPTSASHHCGAAQEGTNVLQVAARLTSGPQKLCDGNRIPSTCGRIEGPKHRMWQQKWSREAVWRHSRVITAWPRRVAKVLKIATKVVPGRCVTAVASHHRTAT